MKFFTKDASLHNEELIKPHDGRSYVLPLNFLALWLLISRPPIVALSKVHEWFIGLAPRLGARN